jgi:hypothetical protein
MYCNDIKQFAKNVGNPKLPEQGKGEHNAVADASWNKVAYEFLDRYSQQSGAFLIAAERQRQIDVEGWSLKHDDDHFKGELAAAAVCYADEAFVQSYEPWSRRIDAIAPHGWPFESLEFWKPSDDPIRNLVKAGALIAAEIDRLQRAKDK